MIMTKIKLMSLFTVSALGIALLSGCSEKNNTADTNGG